MTKDSLKRENKRRGSGWKCSLLSGPLLFKGGACPGGKMVRESREAPSELYCVEKAVPCRT